VGVHREVVSLQNQRSLELARKGITKAHLSSALTFTYEMEAQAQVMLMLVQQNAKLLQELESLKSELAKYKSATPVAPIAPEKPVKVTKKESSKKITVSAEGQAAHKATGHRVAALNAIRKEFMANAQLNGEW